MRHLTISILALLLCATPCWPDCYIPRKFQVENNFEGGACGWCATESIGTYLGYREFKGIAKWYWERGWGPTSHAALTALLDHWKVPYHISTGRRYADLKAISDRGLPAVISFHAFSYYGDGKSGHAVVMCNCTDEYVEWYDPNIIGSRYRYDKETFMLSWGGWAIVLEPNGSTPTAPR